MTTGSDLSGYLSGSRSRIEKQLRDLSSKFNGLEREAADLLKREQAILERFASIQIGEKAELPAQVVTMLDNRKRKIELRAEEAAQAEKEAARLEKHRARFETAARKAEEAFTQKEEEAHAAFDADPEATALRTAIAALQETEQGLAAKHERAVLDMETKSQGYLEDPFFTYLRDRHYGTDRYAGWGFVAKGDRWLARLISWDRKKADFDRLSAIPEWISERLEAVRESLDGKLRAAEEIEARYREPVARFALAAEDAADDLARVEREIAELRERIRAATAFMADAARASDEEMRRTTQAFATLLSKRGFAELRKAAKTTETGEDDRLVDELEKLDAQRVLLQAEADRLKPGIAEFDRRLKAVAQVETSLKSRGWTGRRDEFSGQAASRAKIDELASGVVTAAALWAALERSHRRRPPPQTRSYGSGSSGWSSSGGIGSSSGWSSGGGFGGGSWSSGGGFGGGPSSSGGGF